eukprot:NODE_405_length_7994_cov_0.788600.p5 type:complete len:147 gc:universal NODE_405_length_7994_cov_0.788600:27-467(+)
MIYNEMLNANGNLQIILQKFSPIEFMITEQNVHPISDLIEINRKIRLLGKNIDIIAKSNIKTKYEELQKVSIGKFLAGRQKSFNLISSNWICKECAPKFNTYCNHVAEMPVFSREYTLETEGFYAFITECFIELPIKAVEDCKNSS